MKMEKGLEYAFRDYLNGKNGHRMMQKLQKSVETY